LADGVFAAVLAHAPVGDLGEKGEGKEGGRRGRRVEWIIEKEKERAFVVFYLCRKMS